MLECVQAYNDFLIEYCNGSPARFVPVCCRFRSGTWTRPSLELHRALAAGHKGVIFSSNSPRTAVFPQLIDPHWDRPVAHSPRTSGCLSISTSGRATSRSSRCRHGTGRTPELCVGQRAVLPAKHEGSPIDPRRHPPPVPQPQLRVGGERRGMDAISGRGAGLAVEELRRDNEHPEFDLLPSEYFRRQIYGCFWFEPRTPRAAIERSGPTAFSTRPTSPIRRACLPGPHRRPLITEDYITRVFSDLPDDIARKILHDNAAAAVSHGLTTSSAGRRKQRAPTMPPADRPPGPRPDVRSTIHRGRRPFARPSS